MTLPYQGDFPDELQGPILIKRSVQIADNNQTSSGVFIVGTFYGVKVEKMVMPSTPTGAPIVLVTHEFFMDPGIPAREGDYLAWLSDNTQYRVTKVFHYPPKTVLWADLVKAA